MAAAAAAVTPSFPLDGVSWQWCVPSACCIPPSRFVMINSVHEPVCYPRSSRVHTDWNDFDSALSGQIETAFNDALNPVAEVTVILPVVGSVKILRDVSSRANGAYWRGLQIGVQSIRWVRRLRRIHVDSTTSPLHHRVDNAPAAAAVATSPSGLSSSSSSAHPSTATGVGSLKRHRDSDVVGLSGVSDTDTQQRDPTVPELCSVCQYDILTEEFNESLRADLSKRPIVTLLKGASNSAAPQVTIAATIVRLPCCGHPFHVDCIAGWFENAFRCPDCKAVPLVEATSTKSSGRRGEPQCCSDESLSLWLSQFNPPGPMTDGDMLIWLEPDTLPGTGKTAVMSSAPMGSSSGGSVDYFADVAWALFPPDLMQTFLMRFGDVRSDSAVAASVKEWLVQVFGSGIINQPHASLAPLTSSVTAIQTQKRNVELQQQSHMMKPVELRIGEDIGTFAMRFIMPDCVADKRHGASFVGQMVVGTDREAFLPACDKGQYLLELFIDVFKRRRMFDVGISVSAARGPCVRYCSVHHRSKRTGGDRAHGYPSETYLASVEDDLLVALGQRKAGTTASAVGSSNHSSTAASSSAASSSAAAASTASP